MPTDRSYKARQRDQLRLAEITATTPGVDLATDPAQFTSPYLTKIGIDYLPATVGDGFIKMLPSDFIVEEILQDETIVPITLSEKPCAADSSLNKPHLWADLIKQGLGTFDAVELLAEALGCSIKDIGYAGLKDSRAITAQRITLPNIPLEIITSLDLQGLFLQNIYQAKGVLMPGSLSGNRFTILVRSAPTNSYLLHERIRELTINGFLNFYSLQRFGPRLLTHTFGHLILCGEYEKAVHHHLTGVSPHETAYLQKIRTAAAALWGDWQKMADLFSELPYFFYYELTELEWLINHPTDFSGSLAAINDQTRFATYAYTSYQFNKLLSYYAKQGDIPTTLPLLGPDAIRVKEYANVMSKEEYDTLRWRHPTLPFLIFRPQEVPTRVIPEIHHVVKSAEGYILQFNLRKGAYATTFLSQLFSLYQGKPVPAWASNEFVDTLELLDQPEVSKTLSHISQVSLDSSDLME